MQSNPVYDALSRAIHEAHLLLADEQYEKCSKMLADCLDMLEVPSPTEPISGEEFLLGVAHIAKTDNLDVAFERLSCGAVQELRSHVLLLQAICHLRSDTAGRFLEFVAQASEALCFCSEMDDESLDSCCRLACEFQGSSFTKERLSVWALKTFAARQRWDYARTWLERIQLEPSSPFLPTVTRLQASIPSQ